MRRLPSMLLALVLVATACGGGDDVGDAGPVTTGAGASGPATTSTSPPVTTLPPTDSSEPPAGTTTTTTTTTIAEPTRFVDVYFLKDGQYATAVATRVPATPDVAAQAIRALIAGPSEAQQQIGLFSNVPEDTLLLGIVIADGRATIDLSREFEAGGGSFSMITRLAQVVYTLTQFPSVDRVEFWLDGQPVTVFSTEGLVLDAPVDAGDYLSAVPLTPTVSGNIPRWQQSDLLDLDAVPAEQTRRVVLVVEGDVLNVRLGAGVSYDIMGMLVPGVVVPLTGAQTVVGSSTWVEIATPAGAGWVNDFFLAAVVSDEAFGLNDEVMSLIQEMSEVMAADLDLSTIASRRGLYVSHHAAPQRFRASELGRILTDSTTYTWPSNALDINDPDEASQIPDLTFAEAVADRFTSNWDDADRILTIDEPITGGNGRTPEYAIPFELEGFHYVGVYDPGDNPDYGGLDWTVWYVSIDYEDGRPVVVGLTLDEWAP